MAIPGTAQLADYGCPVAPGTPGTGTVGVNPDGSCVGSACDNPLYKYDHQDVCGAISIVSLALEPSAIAIPKDRLAVVRVIATFSTGQKADVTDESTVNTADLDTAEYKGDGVVYGVDQGFTSIRGVWKGRSADGTVSVTDSACQQSVPWDVIFILDQSVGNYFFRSSAPVSGFGAYFRRTTPSIRGTIDLYEHFLLSFQMGMGLSNPWYESSASDDRAAIYVTGSGTPSMISDWSTALVPFSGYAVEGASRLGYALKLAKNKMSSARAEARKMIVVLTHAGETDCNPSLLAMSSQIKAEGIELAIVTPVSASQVEFFSHCSYPLTVFDYLQGCASPCLFMAGNTPWWSAAQALSKIQQIACGCSYSGVAIGLDVI